MRKEVEEIAGGTSKYVEGINEAAKIYRDIGETDASDLSNKKSWRKC